jgi:hypothetical protein
MAKANPLPDLTGKLTSITVRLTAEEIETLLYIAGRYPADMADEDNLAPALRRCVQGFGGRKAATDQHGGKVNKVRAAKREGSISKAGVTFKRYQPLFAQRPLDAKGTPKKVGEWIRKAPILTWTIKPETAQKAG